MIALWHALVHWMGADYGFPYGTWNWYDFHSGFGGSWEPPAVIAAGGIYLHHKCHARGCWRWARFPVAGGAYKVCAHHHPDLLDNKRPTGEDIARAHWDWKEAHCDPAAATLRRAA